MTNKVYILTNGGSSTDIKSEIAGVYTTEKAAVLAFKELQKYFNLHHQSNKPKIIRKELNPNINLFLEVILGYLISFDSNLNIIISDEPYLMDAYTKDTYIYSKYNGLQFNEVQFEYSRLIQNYTDISSFKGICKIKSNNKESQKEMILIGRNLVLKEANKRLGCLKDMVNNIHMQINPYHDFVDDKMILLKVEPTDSFRENYSKEAKDIFKKFVYDYREALLEYVTTQDSFQKIASDYDQDPVKTISQLKFEIEKILLRFDWYKENMSLNDGLKEFMIHNNIFK